jgi:hypothetical protein
VCAILATFLTSARAQTISNPSFEANAFTVFPGYVSNNATITGWTASPTDRAGLNPASGNPFADNGATPQGSNVAFIQSSTTNFPTSLSNNITGLVSGKVYQVIFRANCRAATAVPSPAWSLNGGPFTNFTASPAVGSTNAYYTNSGAFRATASTASLVLQNQTPGDSTVLVDDFSIIDGLLVTTNTDSGPGSLRQAVLNAATVPGDDTVTFNRSLSGRTITLTNEIVINSGITIDASTLPAGVTLAGAVGTVSNRIFSISAGATNVLRALTLRSGGSLGAVGSGNGGAIYNEGTLTAIGCYFTQNSARTNFGFRGGAIWSSSRLHLTNCTFRANFAAAAGAILTGGTPAGGSRTNSITHCTIYGNNAGFFDAGLAATGAVDVAYCVFYQNEANFSGSDVNGGPGQLTFQGSNIATYLSGSPNGTTPLAANPLLAAVADHGGPTVTIRWQPGSPAYDSAAGSTTATDQRGLPRTAGSAPDLGAYEAQSDPGAGIETLTVNTPIDEFDPIGDGGTGLSLREAIRGAITNATITFAPSIFTGGTNLIPFTPANGQIILSTNLTIDASSIPGGVVLSATGSGNRVLRVDSGSTITLRRLTLTGGNGYPDNNVRGGAIFNAGILSLTDCIVTNNASAEGFGGAILNSGTLRLQRSTFANNRALIAGGAINNFSATSLLIASNCTFTSNRANLGGAIQSASAGATAVMTHCTLFANQATNSTGGGINVASGSVTVSNSIIAANLAVTGSNLNGALLLTGVNLTNGNPLLAPLGDYGGLTPTLALLSNSPALNAASATGAPADQRGYSRFGLPDLGAFERQLGPITNVVTIEDSTAVLNFTAASNFTTFLVTPGNPALAPSNAFVFGGSGTNRILTITPEPNQTGTSTNLLALGLASETAEFVLTVLPVNDAPSFVAGPSQAVPTNSGPQTIPGWATAISPGPADESAQTLTFLVTNSNPSFFSVQPAVSSNGTLTYTIANGSVGIVDVDVQLQDDGGTANGGSDLSTVQSFVIFSYGADATLVNSTFDSGPGSLRQALLHASLIPGPNAITFDSFLNNATISIFTPLEIDSSVTIDASNLQLLSVAAGNLCTVFRCAANTTNTFRSLTIYNGVGDDAGGIYNLGTLTLERCWISSNDSDDPAGAGGIHNIGTLTLDQCRVTDSYNSSTSAGAIRNSGTLHCLRSSIYENYSESGGVPGIINSGTAVFRQSTISDNYGGSIGGLDNSGTAWVLQSTFVDNGNNYNIHTAGTLAISNSIVAPGGFGGSGNLSGTGSVVYAATNILSGNPQLASVGGYGGPVFVRPPLAGSPALDAAINATHTTDQRNCPIAGLPDLGAAESPITTPTPVNWSSLFTNGLLFTWTGPTGATFVVRLGSDPFSLPSVGSPTPATSSVFTVTNALPLPVTRWRVDSVLGSNTFIGPVLAFLPNSPIVENTNADGYGSLTRLLSIAPPDYLITFATNLSGAGIRFFFAVDPTNSFTMDASALPAGIRLLGNGTSALFSFTHPTTNQFKHITFAGGSPAIFNFHANLTAVDCLFISNQSSFGGAVFNDSPFTLIRCSLAHNSASSGGGALYHYPGGVLHLVQCTLASNTAPYGGAIYNRGPLVLTHSTVAANSAPTQGGGIYREDTNQPAISITLSNSIVAGNSSPMDPDLVGPFAAVQSLTNGNPLLGALGNYGGRTPTLPLLTNSPARDAAVGSTNLTDQRGVPVFGIPDLGAFEARPPTNFLYWASETAGQPLIFGADSENDGGVNGLEYALRRNPLVRDSAILPTLAGTNGGRTFTFNYRPAATDLRYIVQRSSNLTTWTEVYRNDLTTGVITRSGVTSTENAGTQITTIHDPATGRVLHWRLRVEKQ